MPNEAPHSVDAILRELNRPSDDSESPRGSTANVDAHKGGRHKVGAMVEVTGSSFEALRKLKADLITQAAREAGQKRHSPRRTPRTPRSPERIGSPLPTDRQGGDAATDADGDDGGQAAGSLMRKRLSEYNLAQHRRYRRQHTAWRESIGLKTFYPLPPRPPLPDPREVAGYVLGLPLFNAVWCALCAYSMFTVSVAYLLTATIVVAYLATPIPLEDDQGGGAGDEDVSAAAAAAAAAAPNERLKYRESLWDLAPRDVSAGDDADDAGAEKNWSEAGLVDRGVLLLKAHGLVAADVSSNAILMEVQRAVSIFIQVALGATAIFMLVTLFTDPPLTIFAAISSA